MANAVTYAEQTLGVHEVWKEAHDRLAAHEREQRIYLDTLKVIRSMKMRVADREADITAAAATDPDFMARPSKTARNEWLKDAFTKDAARSDLLTKIADAEAERDEAQGTSRHHELGVQACTARMTELGGLLAFYAAAKAAESAHPILTLNTNNPGDTPA